MPRVYLNTLNFLGFDEAPPHTRHDALVPWVLFEKQPDGSVNVDSYCDVTLTPENVQQLLAFLRQPYRD